MRQSSAVLPMPDSDASATTADPPTDGHNDVPCTRRAFPARSTRLQVPGARRHGRSPIAKAHIACVHVRAIGDISPRAGIAFGTTQKRHKDDSDVQSLIDATPSAEQRVAGAATPRGWLPG